MITAILVGVVAMIGLMFFLSLVGCVYNCPPSEVLIFTGSRRRIGDRFVGYRVIKGGMGIRWPMIERVDKLDLTNMVIDVAATNAYSKGGIPLTVQGMANVKVAGHEPLLNNAIERFLGKNRNEIMAIAKATLEGSLRGVLSTMTPEQVNEDRLLFAERLVAEVEQDMTALGLVVDTLKIQSVTDEVKYLDSIGRRRNAEVVSKARIAEAIAQADSIVRSAENLQKETRAQVDAQMAIAKAEADRSLVELRARKLALIAEELATVTAAVAKATADVEVQKARLEQVRQQVDADLIQPAKASAEAAEAAARAEVAPIIEQGKARAEALRKVAMSLKEAGPAGREMLVLQKLPAIIEALTDAVAETEIAKLTVIDAGPGGSDAWPLKAVGTLEQIKQLFGVDIAEKLRAIAPIREVEREGDGRKIASAGEAIPARVESVQAMPAPPVRLAAPILAQPKAPPRLQVKLRRERPDSENRSDVPASEEVRPEFEIEEVEPGPQS